MSIRFHVLLRLNCRIPSNSCCQCTCICNHFSTEIVLRDCTVKARYNEQSWHGAGKYTRSIKRRFVILRFVSIYFAINGAMNMIRYTLDLACYIKRGFFKRPFLFCMLHVFTASLAPFILEMDHPSWTNLHTNQASKDSSSDNRPFPSSGLPLSQRESSCKTFHMKMSLICMKMNLQVKHIFKRMVSHLDSF